jgi:hypothetical protein
MKEKPTINIHSKTQELSLDTGKYHINVIGGFLIKKNNFKIKITSNKGEIPIKKTKFPLQSLENGKREKRCYEFKIIEKGKYSLEFKNSRNLIVKRSNVAIFFPFNLFNKPIPNEQIEIRIISKSYW